jgi:myo-inositol-1(or 4)-monophosphatase
MPDAATLFLLVKPPHSPVHYLGCTMSQALHPMLNIAIKAARTAGSIINRASQDVDILKVSSKSPNDFVTEVDQAAEAAIIETLLGAYPGHGILGEETGRTHGARDSDYLWIIDPLDGTTNFIHGFPVYCVSIALAFRGVIQQAVVYDPTRNDLFYASKGRGAFLNDKRIRVAARRELGQTVLATGIPFMGVPGHATFLKELHQIANRVSGVRRFGSAALDLAYVAAGRFDGYWERGPSKWDVAAGTLLVTEAGGMVSEANGGADPLNNHSILAANAELHPLILQKLRAAA